MRTILRSTSEREYAGKIYLACAEGRGVKIGMRELRFAVEGEGGEEKTNTWKG